MILKRSIEFKLDASERSLKPGLVVPVVEIRKMDLFPKNHIFHEIDVQFIDGRAEKANFNKGQVL